MSLKANSLVGGLRHHVIRSAMVAMLTMAAMLLGLLVLHSATTGDAASGTVSSVSAPDENAAVETGIAHVVPVLAHINQGSHAVADGIIVGCLIAGMACLALLILGTGVILARRPAVYPRLLDAGGFVVDSFREIPLHLQRPSLTFLSISRV